MEELIQNLYNPDNKIAYSALKELEKLSKDNNDVYKYFDTFVEMLDSENSYIRTRGIILISNNAKWDCENKLNKIIDKFLLHIEDDKPITARQCIKSLENIIKHKEELIPIINKRLLEINYLKYDDSMQSLIFKDVEKILELVEKEV